MAFIEIPILISNRQVKYTILKSRILARIDIFVGSKEVTEIGVQNLDLAPSGYSKKTQIININIKLGRIG